MSEDFADWLACCERMLARGQEPLSLSEWRVLRGRLREAVDRLNEFRAEHGITPEAVRFRCGYGIIK